MLALASCACPTRTRFQQLRVPHGMDRFSIVCQRSLPLCNLSCFTIGAPLQGMDIFSNILYVKEEFAALSSLAHRCAAADKYRPESCCVIGNYYSLRQAAGRGGWWRLVGARRQGGVGAAGGAAGGSGGMPARASPARAPLDGCPGPRFPPSPPRLRLALRGRAAARGAAPLSPSTALPFPTACARRLQGHARARGAQYLQQPSPQTLHCTRCRGMHERAVQYFRRALRLNPSYLSAWTLMGHEYVELKNPPAAIGEGVCGGG